MADKLKIITHTTYTYETSDGREFDDKNEAKNWQKILSSLEPVQMLSSNYKPTKEIESAYYVCVETIEQVEAFNMMSGYLGMYARIREVGYYRYDEKIDDFVNVESEIESLQHIIKMLDAEGE